jgi:hypothetical protein
MTRAPRLHSRTSRIAAPVPTHVGRAARTLRERRPGSAVTRCTRTHAHAAAGEALTRGHKQAGVTTLDDLPLGGPWALSPFGPSAAAPRAAYSRSPARRARPVCCLSRCVQNNAAMAAPRARCAGRASASSSARGGVLAVLAALCAALALCARGAEATSAVRAGGCAAACVLLHARQRALAFGFGAASLAPRTLAGDAADAGAQGARARRIQLCRRAVGCTLRCCVCVCACI